MTIDPKVREAIERIEACRIESTLDSGEVRRIYTINEADLEIIRSALAAKGEVVAAEPQWIVNDNGELGVMVSGRAFFLYKGGNLEYESGLHDDGTPVMYRIVGKREFGETQWPMKWIMKWILAGRRPEGRYTEPLVFTPGLSFGQPEDGDWRPLHPAPAPPSDDQPSYEEVVRRITGPKPAPAAPSDETNALIGPCPTCGGFPYCWPHAPSPEKAKGGEDVPLPSSVSRYDFHGFNDSQFGPVDGGTYVRYEDYARQAQEIARLRESRDGARSRGDRLHNELIRERERAESAEREVSRLRGLLGKIRERLDVEQRSSMFLDACHYDDTIAAIDSALSEGGRG